MGGRQKITNGIAKFMVQQYREGKSIAKIAQMLGVARETVRTHLQKQGVKMRDNNGRP